jgi:hypothetical protein
LRSNNKKQQGITNTLALPIDKKMLYISTYSEHTKTIHSNLNNLNTFAKETSSPKQSKHFHQRNEFI